MKWRFLKYVMSASLMSWQLIPGHVFGATEKPDEMRSMRFKAQSPDEAIKWQKKARAKLFQLMMGGKKPEAPPLKVELIKKEPVPDGGYYMVEATMNSLPDRSIHVWLAVPERVPEGGAPGMLALHGHGGAAEMIVRGEGPYWYGKAFAEKGYFVASVDIGQHDLQHEDWSLMGERTWDALVCLDYLCSRPEVDSSRIGTIGLSLGGETVMYVAAMDERIKTAFSSGWLNTIANMKQGHCPCWNFPGLEEHFDFSDIFSCVAPRPLLMQIGRQEKAPGGFPLDVAQGAFKEIQKAYGVLDADDNCALSIHDGGHEIESNNMPFEWFGKALK